MEKILLIIAKILRILPSIKGKYRLGLKMEEIFLPSKEWKTERVLVTMKENYRMWLEPNSVTHKVALYCGVYEREEINFFEKVVQHNWLILDIGASIGYWTIPFGLKFKKNRQDLAIICFEPLPLNQMYLEENIAINGLTDIVHVEKCALGNVDGQITIRATEKGKSGNAYISKEVITSVGQTYETAVVIKKLDSFTDVLKRCDFIKMDIEGSEILVIMGGLAFINKFRPIIYGEFNSKFLDNLEKSIKDVDDLLLPLSYVSYVIKGKKPIKISTEKNMEDIIYVPEEKVYSFLSCFN